ncbi:MAG: transcriptional regulator, partial [Defluviitaleaceae bacterium]|nr:transcriptional regulator [Defluviitaleaceae bacterium]
VCNNKLDMITKSNLMPRLQVFLNTVNNKNDFRNTIWFGIVGDIEFNIEDNVKLTRERFKGNKKVARTDINTMESLSALMYGIVDYKVQVFFSFETCEETSFTAVATRGVDDYIEKTKVLSRKDYSEFAVPCLPNLSIVPKNKSGLILDSLMIATEEGAELSQEKKDLLKLWVEGVYVPASYLAAGITAAYQCPDFLRTHFKNVTPDYPGVRFDIEASDHALRVPTTLAKEISGFTNNIKDSINNRNFGFLFSSDNNQVDGKELRQITVYKARTMQMVNNEFESLYKTLTATYISRMMRAQTSDYKQDNVVFFFSANPQSQKSKWSNKDSYINSILSSVDTLAYNIEEEYSTCNIDIGFGGNTKNLEIVLNKAGNM